MGHRGLRQRGQATGSDASLSMPSAVSPLEIQCYYCDYVLSYGARPDFYFNAPRCTHTLSLTHGALVLELVITGTQRLLPRRMTPWPILDQ